MCPAEWSIRTVQITTGTGTIPTASVELAHADGVCVTDAAVGDGPVDAVFKALRSATNASPIVRSYRVRSVTDGDDAQGEVVIDAEHNGRRFHGRAVGTDIVEASARAFLDIVNRMARVTEATVGTAAHARDFE
jgi:2-isopropylmalate synthase